MDSFPDAELLAQDAIPPSPSRLMLSIAGVSKSDGEVGAYRLSSVSAS
jgi:hypothetical protein